MAIEKATLTPLKPGGKKLQVQFNPESLRVSRRRYGSAGIQSANPNDARQGASQQSTGHGATMSIELLFDTSETGKDVLKTTGEIAAMMASSAADSTAETKVQFHWGTFIFTGTIESMDETIDLFSEQGIPLRSTVSLSMVEGRIEREEAMSGGTGAGFGAGISAGFSAGISASAGFSAGASLGAGFSAGAAVGTQPFTLAQSGDTLQGMAARAGVDWKAVATANGIDNPRLLQPGAVVNLNASAGASGSASTSGSASAGASANASASFG
jgi:LysM repeat protein